jgi:Protein of unknown function (DUF3341)
MTGLVLAEFSNCARFVDAARRAHASHRRILDAFTPFPVEDVFDLIDHRRSRIRVAMFIGGIAMAAIAYGTEYYSAAIDYPNNSGGRPFDAWPAFMLVPFATGILVAAVAGFATFLVETGLPRLHDPLFAVEGFERASQDRFVLALAQPDGDDDRRHMIDFLRNAGATAIREVAS